MDSFVIISTAYTIEDNIHAHQGDYEKIDLILAQKLVHNKDAKWNLLSLLAFISFRPVLSVTFLPTYLETIRHKSFMMLGKMVVSFSTMFDDTRYLARNTDQNYSII